MARNASGVTEVAPLAGTAERLASGTLLVVAYSTAPGMRTLFYFHPDGHMSVRASGALHPHTAAAGGRAWALAPPAGPPAAARHAGAGARAPRASTAPPPCRPQVLHNNEPSEPGWPMNPSVRTYRYERTEGGRADADAAVTAAVKAEEALPPRVGA